VLDSDIDLSRIRIEKDVTPATREKLYALIMKYKQVFAWTPKHLGRSNQIKLDIDTGDSKPIRQAQFPHPEKVHEEIQKHVDTLVERGFVTETYESGWSSPSFLIAKKDETGAKSDTVKRYIIDYRSLNSVTKKVTFAFLLVWWTCECNEDISALFVLISFTTCYLLHLEHDNFKFKYVSKIK
jgi:hypothetical protein